MIAPRLVLKRECFRGIFVLVTGPMLAAYLTKSLNEQASIWCFFSMFLCSGLMLSSFVEERQTAGGPARVVIHGGNWGEKPMEYHLADMSHKGDGNGIRMYEKSNGKKVN